MEEYAPRLCAIANELACCSQKALVLIAKRSGSKSFLERLRGMTQSARFGVSTTEDHSEFNSPG
jgi:hypothetical protein